MSTVCAECGLPDCDRKHPFMGRPAEAPSLAEIEAMKAEILASNLKDKEVFNNANYTKPDGLRRYSVSRHNGNTYFEPL